MRYADRRDLWKRKRKRFRCLSAELLPDLEPAGHLQRATLCPGRAANSAGMLRRVLASGSVRKRELVRSNTGLRPRQCFWGLRRVRRRRSWRFAPGCGATIACVHSFVRSRRRRTALYDQRGLLVSSLRKRARPGDPSNISRGGAVSLRER